MNHCVKSLDDILNRVHQRKQRGERKLISSRDYFLSHTEQNCDKPARATYSEASVVLLIFAMGGMVHWTEGQSNHFRALQNGDKRDQGPERIHDHGPHATSGCPPLGGISTRRFVTNKTGFDRSKTVLC